MSTGGAVGLVGVEEGEHLSWPTSATEVAGLRTIEGQPHTYPENNVRKYIKYALMDRLTDGKAAEYVAFCRGFHDVMPASFWNRHNLSVFHMQQLILQSLTDDDVDRLKAMCGGGSNGSGGQHIRWFKECIDSAWHGRDGLTKGHLKNMLFCATATHSVPSTFKVTLRALSQYGFHTCFNQIDLPTALGSREEFLNGFRVSFAAPCDGYRGID